MYKHWIAAVTATTLGAHVMMPTDVHGGQSEWATAGKILTGVVAARVIMNHGRHHRQHNYRHHGYRRSCHQHTRTQVYHVSPPPVVHHTTVHHTTYHNPCPTTTIHHHHVHQPCIETGPVIIYRDSHQRVYQPRVHGHPAFVQVWSDCERRWVNTQTHPSVY